MDLPLVITQPPKCCCGERFPSSQGWSPVCCSSRLVTQASLRWSQIGTLQEFKVGTKSKIMDMVCIRHLATGASVQQGEEQTTMIILCEDGSLKI